jgi:glycine/D-amino acid oxidase-like deaminating enzyme
MNDISHSEHPEDTQLKLKLESRNPDDGMTSIAYVKGAFFLKTLEQKVGRELFDKFLKNYFKKFSFKTITTEDFIDYLNSKTNFFIKESDVYSDDSLFANSFGFIGFQKAYKNRLEGSLDTGKLITELYKKTVELGIQTLFGINLESYTEAINEVNLNTNFGELKCVHLLVCTNGFANEFLQADLQPARAQVMITKPIHDLKFEGTFHFDAGYYYFRNIENRILIGGGRNLNFEGETTEKFGTTDQIQDSILDLLKENILPDTPFEIDYSWSGIMGIGQEKSPIIKKVNNRVAFGVRMGGMGLAIGSEVGKKLANIF